MIKEILNFVLYRDSTQQVDPDFLGMINKQLGVYHQSGFSLLLSYPGICILGKIEYKGN